jgi:hypothetical protein
MTDNNGTTDKFQRFGKAQSEANRINKDAVFDLLAAAEITSVSVGFDGEGDSGQISEIIAFKNTEMGTLPERVLTILEASWSTGKLDSRQTKLCEAMETLCFGYLSQDHGCWQDNDGAFGQFIFDVTGRTIELEFNARFTDSTLFCHSF